MNESRVVIATFDTGSDPRRHRTTGGLLQCVAVPPDGAVPDRTSCRPTAGRSSASCGLEFASSSIGDITGPVDTLMVAGGADMDAACADPVLLEHVRRLAADARRVTSVCSGAFVLAAAGLLEGRRATTHWAECEQLNDRYDAVTVDADAIYVHDGNVWTSAGVTAGIDLALALVADDHGNNAAATVARQLVVYLQTLRRASPVLRRPRRPGRRHRTGAGPARLASRPPHRRPVRSHPRPPDQPVGTAVLPCVQDRGRASRRRATSRPSASSRHAGCSRRRNELSNRWPGPAASALPKPCTEVFEGA